MRVARDDFDPLGRVLDVVPIVSLTVSGSSMRPFAPEGSRIECRRPRNGENLLHRVIVARDADRRLAHRVVATWVDQSGKRWVRMRGDNSVGCEDLLQRDVIGVVDAMIIRGMRVPLHRLPARLEGGIAWIGRQVVVLPRRVQRLKRWMRVRVTRARAAG